MLSPRVHRPHGRPHLGQIPQPASNQRWCSDVFLIPCRSGEVVSVAFAIDCHDREVPAYVASPRPLTGGDVRTLMDRTLSPRPRTARSRFRANEVRLLLGIIAYNLGNLLRRLALPLTIQSWSLTSLQQWLFKTGVTTFRTG
jgi:transposase InsO family protein